MQLRKESKVVMRVKEIITQDKFYFKTLEQFFFPTIRTGNGNLHFDVTVKELIFMKKGTRE